MFNTKITSDKFGYILKFVHIGTIFVHLQTGESKPFVLKLVHLHYLLYSFKLFTIPMRRISQLSAFVLGLFFVSQANAQDSNTDNHQITVVVPTVALLDLETAANKNFTASFVQPTPLEAGQKIDAPANNTDLWINYSSIISSTVTSRKVEVKASALVPGVTITVVAGASSTGEGTLGTPTSAVTLTTADQSLITGIGSAYTGTGASNGHNLTYTFTAPDGTYADLRADSTPITITYTLSDN